MNDGDDLESDLPDFSTIDLRQLSGLPDSVLVRSLRRILEQAAELPDQYAAFQNAP